MKGDRLDESAYPLERWIFSTQADSDLTCDPRNFTGGGAQDDLKQKPAVFVLLVSLWISSWRRGAATAYL